MNNNNNIIIRVSLAHLVVLDMITANSLISTNVLQSILPFSLDDDTMGIVLCGREFTFELSIITYTTNAQEKKKKKTLCLLNAINELF